MDKAGYYNRRLHSVTDGYQGLEVGIWKLRKKQFKIKHKSEKFVL